jgi:hypothetical protein
MWVAISVAPTPAQKIIVSLHFFSLSAQRLQTDVLPPLSPSLGVPPVSIINIEKSLSPLCIERKFFSKLLFVVCLPLRMMCAWSQNYTKRIGDIMVASTSPDPSSAQHHLSEHLPIFTS